MPKMVVNTDAYTLAIPNQAPNQPPVARTLRRGEVVDVSAEEAERGKSITVRNHYTVGTVTVPRDEPSLLPAEESTDHAAAAINAVAESRTEALLRELAAVSSTLPPERLAQIAENVSPTLAGESDAPTVAGDEDTGNSGTPVVTTRPEDEPPAPAPAARAPAASPAPAPPGPPPAPATATVKATATTRKSAPRSS